MSIATIPNQHPPAPPARPPASINRDPTAGQKHAKKLAKKLKKKRKKRKKKRKKKAKLRAKGQEVSSDSSTSVDVAAVANAGLSLVDNVVAPLLDTPALSGGRRRRRRDIAAEKVKNLRYGRAGCVSPRFGVAPFLF